MIRHQNIYRNFLKKIGLHLNEKGNNIFFSNFVNALDNSSMHWIPISTGTDQTSAAEENFNLSYESSKADETSVIEENSNLIWRTT